MASNVSNLLKEKIVTPVANSLATQVDNKVKNGIILRKFIGVQLGESNTGCQLVKIDLNKINVKDPSYEFTIYIKAFSQKGLFNFIINVNKTDSLQVDVKCEVKNSDSNNGEVIGYYDVDAVGNTITISLLKAFVVNTSINECKFVSTKDTLNISDLDIDWSDTGNVKNDTSINIKGKESNIEIDVDKYLSIDCGTLGENQRYRIATIDYSKLSEAKYFDGTSWSPTIGNSMGCFVRIKIASNLLGMMILEIKPLLLSRFDISSAMVILESKGTLTFSIDSDKVNIDAFLYKRENKSIQIFYNNDLFSTTSKDTIHVFSCEIISLNAKLDPDTIKVTFDMDTTTVTDTLNGIQLENGMNLYKVFTTNVNSIVGSDFNGLVPGPNKTEAENKYLLGADAKWHPRKTVNDSFINLEPDDTIKGLDIEDITKAVSFVTFDFTNIIAKLTELSKSSTSIPFEMNLRTASSGDHHIDGNFTVNKSGLIPTTACITPLSKKGAPIGYLENPSEFYGEVIDNPCFYIMDNTLKTVTFALYTPFANSSVCIKDFYIHIDESIASLSDILIEWKLIAIDKPGWAPLKVQKFTNGSILPLTRTFEQMNIETPIDEADSFTLEKERVKNNGLVPAPGKYEVDNGYVLGADAKWHPRKAGNEYIVNLKPTEEIKGLSETDTTKGISFVTIDFNSLSQKIVEAATSTLQEFMIHMKVLTRDLGIITISTRLTATTAGLIGCSGVLSDRGMGSNTVSFSTTYSGKLGAVVSPGFFVNDMDTKILKIALYTPIAINGVKIIDAGVTSYSDIIDESDIVFTWELGILEKKPYQLLRSNIIYPRIDLDRELVFDQMNIETPISETDEDTLFAEQIKHNGLVPAPGKYEVNNGYYLKADGSWDLPKNSINDYIALVTPSEEMVDQTGTTTGVSFVTIDYSKAYEKLSLGTNETTGFRLYLTIFNETYGKLEISLRTIIVNLGENINQGVIAYADIGTESGGLSLQLVQIQNNYGEDIRTPIFTDIDPTTYKIRVGIYAVGINKPVIVKNCTIHQTHDTIDTHDIDILWEANVVTFSEENTKSASQYTNINLNKTFTPIIYMRDPEGSYSESQVRRWRLESNGFVPAPAKYEADQGRVLCADGSWIPTRGNNNAISRNQLEASRWSEIGTTKAVSFVTIDFTDLCAQFATLKESGSFNAAISMDLMISVLGKIHIDIFIYASADSIGRTIHSDIGTGYYSPLLSYYLYEELGKEHLTPGFSIVEGKTLKLAIYGSYGTDMINVIDCTAAPISDVVLDINKLKYNWEITVIDIPEDPDDFELGGGVTRNTVFKTNNYYQDDAKLRNGEYNGLVPAPRPNEEDHFLKGDGTWASANDIMNTITTNPEDEGKILKAHNGSVIWASLINGEEVGY